jgi:hypothetical protein
MPGKTKETAYVWPTGYLTAPLTTMLTGRRNLVEFWKLRGRKWSWPIAIPVLAWGTESNHVLVRDDWILGFLMTLWNTLQVTQHQTAQPWIGKDAEGNSRGLRYYFGICREGLRETKSACCFLCAWCEEGQLLWLQKIYNLSFPFNGISYDLNSITNWSPFVITINVENAKTTICLATTMTC